MSEKYKGIINLPHHVSKKRRQMPMFDRAAQFSPFAPLSGFDPAVRVEKVEHQTECETEMSDVFFE